MRYLKSAALLLLTASSSVSLLSAVAKADQGGQEASPKERIDNPTDGLQADDSKATTEKTESKTYWQPSVELADAEAVLAELDAAEAETPSVLNSAILTPLVDEMRSPRFDLLRARLRNDPTQSHSAETHLEEPHSAESIASNEIAPDYEFMSEFVGEANPKENLETATTNTADTTDDADIIIEVTDNTNLPYIAAEPESFIQPPTLTLQEFQNLVADAEQTQSDQTLELAQAEADDSLPVLNEADPPAADPEAENMEADTPPTETAPTETEATDTDGIPAEPGTATENGDAAETDAQTPPPAEPSVDSEGLPDSLFADPNPLSFPTQINEVDIEQNPVVTLEQVIALAYQNNQALQASLLALEQAEAGVAVARAANQPTVNAGGNLTNTQNNGSRTVLGGTIEVEYDLLTGGLRDASIRAAELQQQVSALTVESQQEQIRLATATAYYALQDAGEQIRINQSFLDEAARNLRDAQLRQEVGVGTKFDTLRAEVQFANARQSLIQSQGNQRIARRDISRLLNLPPTSGLTATPVEVGETWPLTLEESILLAFQNRAELEQQLLQADITEQQRRQALAAVRPQVSVFANYSPQLILEGANVFEDDFQDSVSFGTRFSWQLYDGGAARAQARQQELAGAIAEEQFSETLDQVRFDVEQAYFNLETNQENILTSQVAVAQAEEALALANLRLQAGVGTQLDVLTAQSELTQAEGNNVAAILGYNRALVAIERAISNVATPF